MSQESMIYAQLRPVIDETCAAAKGYEFMASLQFERGVRI